jgi:hypothetical protein
MKENSRRAIKEQASRSDLRRMPVLTTNVSLLLEDL